MREKIKLITDYGQKKSTGIKKYIENKHNKYTFDLFSWDEFPINDSDRFIEFLKKEFDIDVDWVKKAKIDEIDGDTAIKISHDKNYLSLNLNPKKTKVKLEIDGDRTIKFYTKKTEKDKRIVYHKSQTKINYHIILDLLTCVNIRLLVFIRTLIFVFIASHIIIWLSPRFLNIPQIFVTNSTSAQYILSALAQSQAAIIAIVFTALLIFIQMSMGFDSKQKELDGFLKSREVVLLISLYAYSIGYDLVLLAMIKTENEVNVFWPIVLMIILVLYLIPSMINMVQYIRKNKLASDILTGKNKFAQYANLSGASFVGAILDGINFYNTDLRSAIFKNATLHECDFTGAHLEGTKIYKSDLRKCNFFEAHFNEADLWMVNFSGVNLSGAEFRGAAMWNANLSGVNASDADFTGADLGGANLSGAYFAGTILKNVNFSRACMVGIDLMGANLQGANLSGVDLSGSNLSEAKLDKAKLIGANLSGARLRGANLSKVVLKGDFKEHIRLRGNELARYLLETDLRMTDLRGTDLSGEDLNKKILRYADLRFANLTDMDLQKADLRGTDMRLANLSNTQLQGADLRNSDLRAAKLDGANLIGANLENAKLCEASLKGVDLTDAVLRYADLRNVEDVHTATLTGADLRYTRVGELYVYFDGLHEIVFAEASSKKPAKDEDLIGNVDLIGNLDLSGIDSSDVDLSKVDLSGINLDGAVFRDAKLGGVDWTKIDLKGVYLTPIFVSRLCSTKKSTIFTPKSMDQ